MLIAAVVITWVLVAGTLAVVLGRAAAISEKNDRWRHGRREVRDPRRLHPVVPLADAAPAATSERSAA